MNFVCINDDMKLAPAPVVRALRDFYMSFFPLPSSFELPPGAAHGCLPHACLPFPFTWARWRGRFACEALLSSAFTAWSPFNVAVHECFVCMLMHTYVRARMCVRGRVCVCFGGCSL